MKWEIPSNNGLYCSLHIAIHSDSSFCIWIAYHCFYTEWRARTMELKWPRTGDKATWHITPIFCAHHPSIPATNLVLRSGSPASLFRNSSILLRNRIKKLHLQMINSYLRVERVICISEECKKKQMTMVVTTIRVYMHSFICSLLVFSLMILPIKAMNQKATPTKERTKGRKA